MAIADPPELLQQAIQGIVILSAGPSHYCVRSVVDEHPWYKLGPEGPITNAYCA